MTIAARRDEFLQRVLALCADLGDLQADAETSGQANELSDLLAQIQNLAARERIAARLHGSARMTSISIGPIVRLDETGVPRPIGMSPRFPFPIERVQRLARWGRE